MSGQGKTIGVLCTIAGWADVHSGELRLSFADLSMCRYCYALGYTAGALISQGQTGLMATVFGLHRCTGEWGVGGFPLTAMMCVERRKGKLKPVIRKALVQLDGPVFKEFAAHRAAWALDDAFRFRLFRSSLSCCIVFGLQSACYVYIQVHPAACMAQEYLLGF